MSKRIAILASGGGSNAEKIMQHFATVENASIELVACNRKEAGVYARAAKHNVKSMHITRDAFYNSDEFLNVLKEHQIDFIVLAGFLWFIPENLVRAFEGKMVNIHPALLPKYGGKGMFGHYVHQAVKAAGESESGMTIHWVNEAYDEGGIIFQDRTPLDPNDSAEDIASKVLQLEHKHYARVIEDIIS